MKIAVPTAGGAMTPHFGGADAFAVFTVDEGTNQITERVSLTPPAHERGVFPAWLRSQGVTAVLAGGIGGRASAMLAGYGIEVVMGAEERDPAALVDAYLAGRLQTTGAGPCGGGALHGCGDHDHGHRHQHER